MHANLHYVHVYTSKRIYWRKICLICMNRVIITLVSIKLTKVTFVRSENVTFVRIYFKMPRSEKLHEVPALICNGISVDYLIRNQNGLSKHIDDIVIGNQHGIELNNWWINNFTVLTAAQQSGLPLAMAWFIC